MNMIRTDQQAVLDQLCQPLQESADHYRDTADIFADEEAAFLRCQWRLCSATNQVTEITVNLS